MKLNYYTVINSQVRHISDSSEIITEFQLLNCDNNHIVLLQLCKSIFSQTYMPNKHMSTTI